MTNEDTIQILNELSAVCRHGEMGYRTAAEHIENTQLATVFWRYSNQRKSFARKLQLEVSRLGGLPTEFHSISAALHRGWIDLKALVNGGSAAVLAACEAGDDSAKASFKRVVNLDISGQPRIVVEQQWQKIKEAHAHMQRLKQEGAPSRFQAADRQPAGWLGTSNEIG